MSHIDNRPRSASVGGGDYSPFFHAGIRATSSHTRSRSTPLIVIDTAVAPSHIAHRASFRPRICTYGSHPVRRASLASSSNRRRRSSSLRQEYYTDSSPDSGDDVIDGASVWRPELRNSTLVDFSRFCFLETSTFSPSTTPSDHTHGLSPLYSPGYPSPPSPTPSASSSLLLSPPLSDTSLDEEDEDSFLYLSSAGPSSRRPKPELELVSAWSPYDTDSDSEQEIRTCRQRDFEFYSPSDVLQGKEDHHRSVSLGVGSPHSVWDEQVELDDWRQFHAEWLSGGVQSPTTS